MPSDHQAHSNPLLKEAELPDILKELRRRHRAFIFCCVGGDDLMVRNSYVSVGDQHDLQGLLGVMTARVEVSLKRWTLENPGSIITEEPTWNPQE